MSHFVFRIAVLAVVCTAFAAPVLADDNGPTLKIKTRKGETTPGEPYRLVQRQPDGNQTRLQKGDVPDDGVIRLEGDWLGSESVRVTVSFGRPSTDIGQFVYDPAESNVDYSLTLPPNTGDTAPDIKFAELFGGASAKLSDFRGEFVLLDFWASWCPPCQEPMAHNQAMSVEHADDWKGKARIVALSIDDEAETARKHVEEKGWAAMYHAFSSEGDPGWASDAVETYGVWSIPTALLIDPEGEILWRGNPNSVDVEKMIEDVLSEADS